MRIIKGNGIYFSPEEYSSIKIDNQGRYFFEFKKVDIEGELEKDIIISIKNNESRNAICEKHNVQLIDLEKYFKKKYETVKITEVRKKLMNSN